MARSLKTFAKTEPRNIEIALPRTNQFTLDLAGLDLSEDQLATVRQQAVRAALEAAAGLAVGGRETLADFGTFSTFSTFSTFGSGAARPGVLVAAKLNPAALTVIDKVVQPRG